MFSNPIASYKQMDLEADIRGSDPHRLILLLFDGASASLVQAKARIEQKDIPGKSDAIVKAIAIISDGLSASLNLEAGGELANNLKAIYDYMVRRLVHANLHMDISAINEVETLLEEIGGAWREMGENMKKADAANI
jgi:flagellar protein FliS